MVPGFHACPAPDSVLDGRELCKNFANENTGVYLKWCADDNFESWMNDDGSRTYHTQGSVVNLGDSDICRLHFSVTDLDKSTHVWPKWFPNMNLARAPAPLRVGENLTVGADIPVEGFFRPVIELTHYEVCNEAEETMSSTTETTESSLRPKSADADADVDVDGNGDALSGMYTSNDNTTTSLSVGGGSEASTSNSTSVSFSVNGVDAEPSLQSLPNPVLRGSSFISP